MGKNSPGDLNGRVTGDTSRRGRSDSERRDGWGKSGEDNGRDEGKHLGIGIDRGLVVVVKTIEGELRKEEEGRNRRRGRRWRGGEIKKDQRREERATKCK